MSFNLIGGSKAETGYNRKVRHETFCMNLPFLTVKVTGIDNRLLEKQIKDLCKETGGIYSRSIYKKVDDGKDIFRVYSGSRTHQDLHHESLEVSNLCDIALQQATSMFSDRDKGINPFFVMESCWGIVYKKGYVSVTHHHGTTDVSWVYYIKTPKKSSPLIFPQCAKFDDNNELQILQIEPEESLMVLFMGNVDHEVPPSTIDKERIIIAGNIDKKAIDWDKNEN